tara:strand:+ start:2371 stop:2616 length:246 start_codon:yes stop_codon:yes gene_type:complete
MSDAEKKNEVATKRNDFWMRDPRGFVDRMVEKITSRKLLVWSVATVALFLGTVSDAHWVAVSLAYIGSEAIKDIAVAWKRA